MATQAPPCTNAVESVLTINELLEHIILQLPMLHILGSAYRVSIRWKEVIDASPNIQHKRFFRSNSGNVAKPAYFGNEVDEPLYTQSLTLNGALKSSQLPHIHATRLPWTAGFDSEFRLWSCADRSCADRYFALHPEAPPPLEASWRRMFFTDPPCLVVRMVIELCTNDTIKDSFNFDVHTEHGITLGLPEDVAAKAVTNVRRYNRREDYERVEVCAMFEMKSPAFGICRGVGGDDGEDS